MANDPHCFGKMVWILKYPEDNIPKQFICDCHLKNGCLNLTRNKQEKTEGEITNG